MTEEMEIIYEKLNNGLEVYIIPKRRGIDKRSRENGAPVRIVEG